MKYLPGLLLGGFFELMQNVISDNDPILPTWAVFLIATVGFALVMLIVDVLIFTVRAKKQLDSKNTLMEIDNLGETFRLVDDTKMFDVKNDDIIRMEQIELSQSKLKKAMAKSNQIIYHSVTAKENLPWVEYVFWSFLRKAKEKYGCKIIVSLHYSESAREQGVLNSRDRSQYRKLHKKYGDIAKHVIGNDIKIVDEEDFHKKNGRFFAMNFHNVFVKQMLKYVRDFKDLGGPVTEKDYKQFNRRLSYIESVFPILCMSAKAKMLGRIYILDRELAHEIWEEDTWLSEYKRNRGILLLTAQTIRNSAGEAIRIFNPGDTVDINTTDENIKKAVSEADETVKKNLLLLMCACLGKPTPTSFEDLDHQCVLVCIEARTKLNMKDELMC